MSVEQRYSHDANKPEARASRFLIMGLALLAASIALTIALSADEAMANEKASLIVGMPKVQSSAAIDEIEPNDAFENATLINMNESVYGTSSDGNYNGDEDYFKVVLPASGTVKLTFANDRHAQDGGGFYTNIYNQYYERVFETGWGSAFYTKPESAFIKLNKGTNYLMIWASTNVADQPYHFKLTYSIPSTTVKLSSAKGSFTAKWAKKSGAAQYQLRYSAKKNMSGAKAVSISKNSGSKRITGLKTNKKYFVQVRVVKSISGETYYSPWSAKKSVKIKR